MTDQIRRLVTRLNSNTGSVARLVKPHKAMNNLESLMTFINEDDRNKEDYTVKGSEFQFTDRKTLAVKTKQGSEEFAFNPHSFEQLSKLLGIPHKYLENCKVTGKGGMKDQIESRMEQRLAADHIIRLRRTPLEDGVSGMVRAVLPGDFSEFDYRDLVPSLQRAMREVGEGFQMELTNASDPKSVESALHLRFVREIGFDFHELGINDPHKMGFHVRASEIGDGPVTMNALVWRLVCKNGMMGWGDSEVLKITNRNLHKHEVHPQLTEALFSTTRQEAPIRDMIGRKYGEPVADPQTALLLMASKMKVSEHVKDQALEILTTETRLKAEVTRFDLMQSFTRAAHGLSIPERTRLETAVGRYMFGGGPAVIERKPVAEEAGLDEG